jgi:hypothetical protein
MACGHGVVLLMETQIVGNIDMQKTIQNRLPEAFYEAIRISMYHRPGNVFKL